MKWILKIIFLSLFVLVTFFGLGPVLIADGVLLERIFTGAAVIGVYVFLSYLYKKVVKEN